MRDKATRALEAADRFQRAHGFLGFPVAVVRSYSDHSAGYLAALLTYYGFLALFPLLLAGVSVLSVVLRSHPHLQQRLLGSALSQFPVVGTQLRANVHGLPGTSSALVALYLAVMGIRGVGNALQEACNRVWAVPLRERPHGVQAQLRSLGLLAVVGIGVVATAAATGLATGVHLGPLSDVGVLVASVLVDLGLVLAALRLATAPVVGTRDLVLAAVLAAVGLVVLHLLGSWFVVHQLKRTGQVYGSFAVVLGLLGWLYLQANVTMYALCASVVHARRLWPRGLREPPLETADRRALSSYAEAQERLPEEDVSVEWRG